MIITLSSLSIIQPGFLIDIWFVVECCCSASLFWHVRVFDNYKQLDKDEYPQKDGSIDCGHEAYNNKANRSKRSSSGQGKQIHTSIKLTQHMFASWKRLNNLVINHHISLIQTLQQGHYNDRTYRDGIGL